ncbi:MAG: rhodanese-like domain-containing protein [Desulfobulbaceae bacterium]|nr:rhodanese-like domain-containing protein [Desulfobulbaceae bacterium]
MQLDEFYDITVDQFHDYQKMHHEKEYILVDVRLPEEYEDEHIAGAFLLPLGELIDRLNELPHDRDIIFYCNSGRRSRIASVFVTSVPFPSKKIYNLTGGILTYFDRTLPDYPSLKSVPFTGDMEELLISAMNLERGTYLFYNEVVSRVGDTPFAELVNKIAQAEMSHARLLHSYLKKEKPDVAPFEEIYEKLSGGIIEGGQRLDVQLDRLQEIQESSPLALLEMILDIEYAAYDLYRAIAERLTDGKMEESFLSLAQAEKRHMQLASQAFKKTREIQLKNS